MVEIIYLWWYNINSTIAIVKNGEIKIIYILFGKDVNLDEVQTR